MRFIASLPLPFVAAIIADRLPKGDERGEG
jgi:hypothetical protein